MRGNLWIGDLVRALEARPQGDDARDGAVARLLGMTALEGPALPPAGLPGTRPTGTSSPDIPSTDARPPETRPVAPPSTWPARTPRPASPPPLTPAAVVPRPDRSPLLFPATAIGARTGAVPAWSSPALVAAAGRPVHRRRDPAHQLLAPRSGAAILERAMAQAAPDGPIDVAALVGRLARAEPIAVLPRRAAHTMRFGVGVLLDVGTGMELFQPDADDLLRLAVQVAGPGRVTAARFAYAPLRGAGSGPRAGWRPYRPRAARLRVLVLSDFGMGGPMVDYHRADVDEWVAFGREVRRHGATALGLTPYPVRLWPRWLPALFPVLPWDRKITVGQAAARLAAR
jgi:hypothetical protein